VPPAKEAWSVFLLMAFLDPSGRQKKRPQLGGKLRPKLRQGVPHIGTIVMWVSYPPIPLNSFSEIRESPVSKRE
jgi:hypothetical protein